MIDDFLTEVKLRHAFGTFKYYQNHLGHFEKFILSYELQDVSEITDHVIVEYIAFLRETCQNVTINKNVGAIKNMYKELNIDFPYLMSIKKFKERQKSFDALESQDYMKLRKYIRDFDVSFTNGIYYKCFLALLADTGARITEVMMIEKKNVNLERKEILLTHTKTREDRIVYLSNKLGMPAVEAMLKVKSDHKYLLHNIQKDRPARYNDITYILKQVKADLNWKKLHPHMFRHTAATSLIERGMDLPSIQVILGHKNLSTTERYLHMSKKHIKDSFYKIMDSLPD